MLLARRTLSLVALVAALAACSDGTGPDAPRATVTVQPTPLAATTVSGGATTWVLFTVPVRIENTGSTTIEYGYCGDRLEARTGGTWTSAWAPICMATVDWVPVEIPPGESREFSETIQVRVTGPGSTPWLAAPGATEFRFVESLATSGTTGHARDVASNSFTITIAN
jgi:hypothetical protein